jgi:lincosamide nucleotidyltransferase A/C/D/E
MSLKKITLVVFFFEGKTIPCISLKGQKVFHSGYELRDKDKHDISILESLSK